VRLPRAISWLIRRQAILGTAVVCLLGQASAFAHLALVRHATCLEHEDALVHTGGGNVGSSAAQAPADLTPGRRVVAPPPGAADGHEDDHCLMAAFRRSDLAGPDRDHGQALPAAADLAPPPAQAPPRRPGPVPLLLLSPKSSPPLVG
jgi:hypothetical protein